MDLLNELGIAVEAGEPVVWVRRLVVFKSHRSMEVVRNIPLRRGVNIVWADEPDEDVTGKVVVQGHGAGKTTFCRLLRYCLGEANFAKEQDREFIRRTFPEGYVGAEVIVRGSPWAVARPIGRSPFSYAAQGLSVEDLLANRPTYKSFDAFKQMLGDEVLREAKVGRFVRSTRAILWDDILGWCSRDQEARYEEVHRWRSSRSDSDVPRLEFPKADALFVLRMALGVLNDEEIRKQEDLVGSEASIQELRAEIAEKSAEPAYWRRHYHGQLCENLGISKEAVPGIGDETSLLDVDFERKVKEKIAADQPAILDLQKKLTRFEDEAVATKVDLRDLLDELDGLESELQLATTGREQVRPLDDHQAAEEDLRQAGTRWCKYGRRLVKECDHLLDRTTKLTIPIAADMRQAEISETEKAEAVRVLSSRAEALRAQKAQLEAKASRLKGDITSRKEELDVLTAAHTKAQEALADFKKWSQIVSGNTPNTTLAKLKVALALKEKERDKARKTLQSLLEKHEEHRDLLNRIFDKAVQAVLTGGGYSGKVGFQDCDLTFGIYRGPALAGEAIGTLCVLLSDLTAMTYSLCGKGLHPRLLIHDSPREADLGKSIYWSFMHLARDIEQHFTGEPPFQYIITTSTPPPRDMRDKPILVLPLNTLDEQLLKANVFAVGNKEPSLLPD